MSDTHDLNRRQFVATAAVSVAAGHLGLLGISRRVEAMSNVMTDGTMAGVKSDAFFTPKKVPIPMGVSAFPDELYTAPESWAKSAYPKLVHYNKLPKGGHFAAWEQPDFFVSEMRATFKTLR